MSPGRRFVLQRRLGGGEASAVWSAWDRRLRRTVALKAGEAGPVIDHPHLVTPLEVVSTRSGAWVVMDLVRGGTLRDLAAGEGRLPPAYVAVVAEQLLDALAAVHAAGWVHRDVKPANVLLEATGRGRPHVRLADFGGAARVGADDDGAGTAGYVAPEVRVLGRVETSQDIWAAGVLIRQLHDEPSPLTTLTHAMTRVDRRLRPSARDALARVRGLPVPRADRWPEVGDLLSRRGRTAARTRSW